jgi:CheY-like chemotaxis protein
MSTSVPELRILIVEDEPLIRWSLSETLSGSGHVVVEAGDAAGALRAVTGVAAPFDVVLLDFRLPDSNDLALLARLRRFAATTRIVLMTAYGTPEILQAALDLGAHRVISKPFDMNDLAPMVAQAYASGA